jgi:adenine phosphoribosyltransferase
MPSRLKQFIRDIPNFPKDGILFKDITPLLKEPSALTHTILMMSHPFKDEKIDMIASVESRGFLFGVPMAHHLNVGFVPIRKPGKLPGKTIEESYDLEYGTDRLCIHEDSIKVGDRVVLVDDVLATGGTMNASIQLVQKLGAEIVGIAFLMELVFLNGRSKLNSDIPIHSLLSY